MTDVVRFRVEAPAPTVEQVRAWFESNGWVSSGEHRWCHPNNPANEAHVPPDENSIERISYASCMYSGRRVMPEQVYREICGDSLENAKKNASDMLLASYAEEINRWREVGEAAHEVVSLMTEDVCEECSCPLPEAPEDPHDKGCKVGRLVHALSAAGIDPEDR